MRHHARLREIEDLVDLETRAKETANSTAVAACRKRRPKDLGQVVRSTWIRRSWNVRSRRRGRLERQGVVIPSRSCQHRCWRRPRCRRRRNCGFATPEASLGDIFGRPLAALHLDEIDGLDDRVVCPKHHLSGQGRSKVACASISLRKFLAGCGTPFLSIDGEDRRHQIRRIVQVLGVGQTVRLAPVLLLPALDILFRRPADRRRPAPARWR